MPARFRICLTALVCLVILGMGAALCGSPIYVDRNAAGSVHNGSSWQTAFPSISQAISASPSSSEIWVKAGTYPERLILKSYTRIYGGFLGFETSASQRLIGAFPTVLDGRRGGRVVDMPTGSRVTLDGLTIRNGKADRGAGVRCTTNSTVSIMNCRVESCEATVRGGGVMYDTYAMGTMSNCWVIHNKSPEGGGVVVEYHSYPTLQGNVIARNRATLSGGGIFCPFHSGAAMSSCTIAYNQADINGGGVYCDYGGPVTLSRCIVAFNSAPAGGGFYADGDGFQATITGCDLFGNSVGNVGGVIAALPADSANLYDDPVFLMPDADEFVLTNGSPCAGLGAFPMGPSYAIDRIGIGKMLPDQTAIRLTNKVVTCVDGNTTYLEEPNRSAAIAVRGMSGCSVGQVMASVTGVLSTSSGSRVLEASSFTFSSAVYSPRALGSRISWLSTMIGAYARTWGAVTAVAPDGFEITDGQLTLPVRYPGEKPQVGSLVTVDGVYGIDGVFIARDLSPAAR